MSLKNCYNPIVIKLRSNKMKGKHPKKDEKKMPKKPGKDCYASQ